jgi:TolB-like protein
MIPIELPTQKVFSPEEIEQQMQKIFAHPLFVVSDTLRRFLSFIVRETVAGRSNQLKEYTIGVAALNKAANFNPQNDAIVRIHAGRLRRALNQYYKEPSNTEAIHISIPIGRYVPVFNCLIKGATGADIPGMTKQEELKTVQTHNEVNLGVMPFKYFDKNGNMLSFAEGLASQMTTEIAHLEHINVTAYYAMKRLAERHSDLSEVVAEVGTQYVITGDIQYHSKMLRVNVQLIDALSSKQVFSEIYEHKLSEANFFEIQDDVIKQVIVQLTDHYGHAGQNKNSSPIPGKSGAILLPVKTKEKRNVPQHVIPFMLRQGSSNH